MTDEQVEKLAAVVESAKSAHKRIDENDRITNGIHKIATSVETLALQVKQLTDKVDESIESLKGSLKSHGERIGKLEQEPGNRWKSLVAQLTQIIVAAVVGGVVAKFLL